MQQGFAPENAVTPQEQMYGGIRSSIRRFYWKHKDFWCRLLFQWRSALSAARALGSERAIAQRPVRSKSISRSTTILIDLRAPVRSAESNSHLSMVICDAHTVQRDVPGATLVGSIERKNALDCVARWLRTSTPSRYLSAINGSVRYAAFVLLANYAERMRTMPRNWTMSCRLALAERIAT
jgi:hypothetical protein